MGLPRFARNDGKLDKKPQSVLIGFFGIKAWRLFRQKKTRSFLIGFFGIKAWRCPTLTWGDPTLPSALSSFTSEFEMGSGGSYLLLPPDKLVAKLGRVKTLTPILAKLESQI